MKNFIKYCWNSIEDYTITADQRMFYLFLCVGMAVVAFIGTIIALHIQPLITGLVLLYVFVSWLPWKRIGTFLGNEWDNYQDTVSGPEPDFKEFIQPDLNDDTLFEDCPLGYRIQSGDRKRKTHTDSKWERVDDNNDLGKPSRGTHFGVDCIIEKLKTN